MTLARRIYRPSQNAGERLRDSVRAPQPMAHKSGTSMYNHYASAREAETMENAETITGGLSSFSSCC